MLRLSNAAAAQALALDPDQSLAYLVQVSNSTFEPPYDLAADLAIHVTWQLSLKRYQSRLEIYSPKTMTSGD